MNMRVLRERKGMSQAALAEAMNEREHPWHQQTVGRVEAANRKVQFREAVDLAEILETSLDRLMWSSAEANAVESLYTASTRVRRSAKAVSDAVLMLLLDRGGAERALKRVRRESKRVAAAREDVAGSLAECGLQSAVETGVRRWEELPVDPEGPGE
jgi:transcriptional regulator with XRE-family HTH domain